MIDHMDSLEASGYFDDTEPYNPLFATQPSTQPYQHIDADRIIGPSDWDRECQESGRLNRR